MTSMNSDPVGQLQVHPLTRERWDDFERLFGANGACGFDEVARRSPNRPILRRRV